ncbi:hypothetical protein, partial [Thiolapillus sp.]|uniref:hypothetical protein n=1 Tax=Thiolapillus sp. TaxID=2017437 RepID=UPI003AF78C72
MFSLWRKARRENSAASRLLGSTSLRFALHGWQRWKRNRRCNAADPEACRQGYLSPSFSKAFSTGTARSDGQHV